MAEATEADVYDALKACYDPEIPINVVDLGLIYNVIVDGAKVDIDFTLTSIGCPEAAALVEQVRQAAVQVEGIDEAEVHLVWSPPWTPHMATEDGKQQLAMMGVPI